jgi:8-oxo-dGTP diphosphatase
VTDARPRIVVTAAVIRRADEYFVTRRQRGVHLEGFWEFPGGKCDWGETLEACLHREIREELDADVVVRREILTCAHEYPERVVDLHFFGTALRRMRVRGRAVADARTGDAMGAADGAAFAAVSARRR